MTAWTFTNVGTTLGRTRTELYPYISLHTEVITPKNASKREKVSCQLISLDINKLVAAFFCTDRHLVPSVIEHCLVNCFHCCFVIVFVSVLYTYWNQFAFVLIGEVRNMWTQCITSVAVCTERLIEAHKQTLPLGFQKSIARLKKGRAKLQQRNS